jgi:hypothetical protein
MTNKTAAYRNTVACNNTEAGVAHMEVRVHQGWEHTTSTDVYLRGSFHSEAMITGSGKWPALDQYTAWWESTGFAIPKQLLDMVMPGLDVVAQLAEQLAADPRTAGDQSAVEVCNVLKHARKVYLEDAVDSQPKYPGFPAYRHRVFTHPAWASYAREEAARVRVRKQNWLDRDAELAQRVDGLADSLGTQLQLLGDKIDAVAVAAAAPLPAAAAAPSSSSGSGSVVAPALPSIPANVLGVRQFYGEWSLVLKPQYVKYLEEKGGFKWLEIFGKERHHAEKQSYAKVAPWLNFMDSLSEDEVEAALAACEQAAAAAGVKEGTLVRVVFPMCVKPNIKCAHPKNRVCSCKEHVAQLIAALTAAGLAAPLQAATKQ